MVIQESKQQLQETIRKSEEAVQYFSDFKRGGFGNGSSFPIEYDNIATEVYQGGVLAKDLRYVANNYLQGARFNDDDSRNTLDAVISTPKINEEPQYPPALNQAIQKYNSLLLLAEPTKTALDYLDQNDPNPNEY